MSIKEGQSSPSVGGGGSKFTPTQWFTNEIQQMLFGLGDCKRPLHESAALVEEIVQQQMIMLLHKATEVAVQRGGRFIGLEDILFLMRKDKIKLRRLLKYMELKDRKYLALRNLDEEDGGEIADVKVQPLKKRLKICYDFLSTIDQTGELVDLFNDSDDSADEVKQERLMRAELQSRCLEPQEYLEFCGARQVNFSRRYKSQRFKDWLMTGSGLDLKPNAHAMELLSYLAYETVAQIVDLALLVKKDMRSDQANPLVKHMSSVTHTFNESITMAAILGKSKSTFPLLSTPTQSPPSTPATPGSATPGTAGSLTLTPGLASVSSAVTASAKAKAKKRKRNGLPVSMETSTSQAILPSEIQEAMRRYAGMYGPFASQIKVNKLCSPKTKLLCC